MVSIDGYTFYARDVWSEIHVQASSSCASARRTGRPSINEPPPFSDCQSSVYTINARAYEDTSLKVRKCTYIEHLSLVQFPPDHITTLHETRHSRSKHQCDQLHRSCRIALIKRDVRQYFWVELVIVIYVEECVDGLCECCSCMPFHLGHISIQCGPKVQSVYAPRMQTFGRVYSKVRMEARVLEV